MKKIFTFLFALSFFSCEVVLSQAPSCRVLGCAANYGTIVTDNTVPDTLFASGFSFCFTPPTAIKQVYWEYFSPGPANALFSQSFTPPPSVDSVDVDWAIFDIGSAPPANLDCPVNTTGWVEQVCWTTFTPGVPTGPGIGSDPTFNATANTYYAVAIIVSSAQAHPGVASYTFTIDVPRLNGVPTFCNGLVLPVKLSTFNARVNNCGVNLNWTAEIETGFKNYEVQYSTDGTSFKTIATLPAAENPGAPQKYSYTDASPAQGNVFYRLKMIDIDGKFEYSKVVTTKLDCVKSPFSVYPNPVTDILTINNSGPQNEDATVKLFDNNGRLVYSHRLLGGTNTINTRHLPGGIYLLQLNNGIEVQSLKIIK